MATNKISKKRKIVADGVFQAELNHFFQKELAEDGYTGLEVRVSGNRTEIILQATKTNNILGEKGRRIRELTSFVQRRFGLAEGEVEVYFATMFYIISWYKYTLIESILDLR